MLLDALLFTFAAFLGAGSGAFLHEGWWGTSLNDTWSREAWYGRILVWSIGLVLAFLAFTALLQGLK
ncbi:hypothetical protein LCGC14_0295360 [marine sediment metagenome]|uniref:Uncharacterized protein n=1 Tax=marine sediment metagenome TaxID=412755 RepID=A0A0F9WXY5_9ZZZZ